MPAIGIGYGIPFFRSLGTPLSGIPFPGETLTAKTPDQWTIDGTPLPGETGDTYTVGVYDIGKTVRCGNSRPVTIWHPADISAVAACYATDPNSILTAVSPDIPAEPGQTTRRWVDLISGIPADQATGNAQPMLGYVTPPEGNLIRFSEPVFTGNEMTGWNKSQPTVVTVSNGDIPGPFGESTVRVDFSALTPSEAFGAQTTTNVGVGRFKVFAWVKRAAAVSTNVHFRWSGSGSGGATTLETDDWTLISHDGISTFNNLNMSIAAQMNSSEPFYVGRVWIVKPEWSPEYVPTTGTPVIPDTTNLLRALMFDGDNDVLGIPGLRDMYRNASVWGVIAGARATAHTGSGKAAQCIFSTDFSDYAQQIGLYGRGWDGNEYEMAVRYNIGGSETRVVTPNSGDWVVLTGANDGIAGKARLSVDGGIPAEVSRSTGSVQDVQLRGVRIGTLGNNNFTGGITAIIPYAGAITPLELRRLQQYVGLLCGKNLGLSVV